MELCFTAKGPSFLIIILSFYLPNSPSCRRDRAAALGLRSGTKWSLSESQDVQPFREIVQFTSCTCLLAFSVTQLSSIIYRSESSELSGEWKLEWAFDWVVNLCKAIRNSIVRMPHCLRDEMPQIAVFTNCCTPVALGVTQITVPCNSCTGGWGTTRLGMLRPDLSPVAALFIQKLDGYIHISDALWSASFSFRSATDICTFFPLKAMKRRVCISIQ